MALDDATIERIAAASSRQAAQNHGQGPSQQQQQPVHSEGAQSNNQGSNQSDVLTAIQALPEQITRSIKEALQPATNNGATGNGATGNNLSQGATAGGAGSNDASGNQPGSTGGSSASERFAKWWFGK